MVDLSGVHRFHMHELYVPPSDWIAQITSLANRKAKTVHLDGNSTDCRERAVGGGMAYSVVTGDTIVEELPWLMRFYKQILPTYISNFVSSPIVPCANDRYGVNVNVVRGVGGRYEWHVDPSPVAAILFVTAHEAGGGGELVLRTDDLMEVYPEPGLVVVFEGRKIEHAVMPLMKKVTRISIPMLYYHESDEQYFPQALDEYLYGDNSAR